MKTYRVLYYVETANGSLIPHHEDFGSMWRARLQVWLLRHKKEVPPNNIGICVF